MYERSSLHLHMLIMLEVGNIFHKATTRMHIFIIRFRRIIVCTNVINTKIERTKSLQKAADIDSMPLSGYNVYDIFALEL